MSAAIFHTSRGRPGMGLAGALVLLLAWSAAAPGAVRAQGSQEPAPERSRFSGTLALLNTQPLGGLATGPGLGLAATAAWAVDPARRFRLRGEMRAAGYGSEERRACLSETVGCFIEVNINTVYSSLYLGAGPELVLPVLGAELVLDATAGLGAFTVTSSVEGVSDADDGQLLSTNNFSDEFFAWSAGGELRIPVASQASITVGAHYQHNGEASYVPEGGVTRNPDGSLAIDAMTTDANYVAITLGVAVRPFAGFTRDLDDDDRHHH